MLKPVLTLSTLIILLSLLLVPPAAASTLPVAGIDFSALDAVIMAQMQKQALPGVALAVTEGDEIVYLKGYGSAGPQKMSPRTQMFIGSQSKSFTALAIVQLAGQGKLNLNSPVRAYLPSFKVADEEASARITLNQLLHHTSGLSESGYSVLLPPTASIAEAVRSLASARLTAPIGTTFQYFNLGYDVLACIIETVTGQPYAAYIQANIFAPLGMTRSTADPSAATALSWGYTRLFGFAVPMPQPVRTYEIGAGYIISSAEDMARYAIAMQHIANQSGTQLLPPQYARTFFNPGPGAYAMGWQVVDGGARIFHGGANETFRTDVLLYPKSGRAFVLLVNAGHLSDHYVSSPQLTAAVEAIVLGRTPPPVAQGWSVRWIGWGLGLLVFGLVLLHTYNFTRLKSWRERSRRLSPAQKSLDVAVSFIIPTFILVIIFTQMQAFFGYRFNLLTTLAQFRYSLPDVFILMLVGTLPDYTQGLIKLYWTLTARKMPL